MINYIELMESKSKPNRLDFPQIFDGRNNIISLII